MLVSNSETLETGSIAGKFQITRIVLCWWQKMNVRVMRLRV